MPVLLMLLFHRNQQCSVTALTDSAGKTAERYAYTAYGALTIFNPAGTPQATSALNNRYTYTGREHDPDHNLYHFRARLYDPTAGRFLGRDPLGFVDGMGLYFVYLSMDRLDPTGLFTIKLDKVTESGDCVDQPYQKIAWYSFEEPNGWRCTGFLVQKMEVWCVRKTTCLRCRPDTSRPPDLVFFEAFPVRMGERGSKFWDTVSAAGAFPSGKQINDCEGSYFKSEIRYYCAGPPSWNYDGNNGGSIGNMGWVDSGGKWELTKWGRSHGWKEGRVIPGKNGCDIWANHANFSKGLRAPPYWDKVKPIEKHTKTTFSRNSCCHKCDWNPVRVFGVEFFSVPDLTDRVVPMGLLEGTIDGVTTKF